MIVKKKNILSKVVLRLMIFALLYSSNSFSQVNQILNFETPGFYLMPSETGTHNNKWIIGTYLNSKAILKDMPLRSYAISGDYQLKRGMESLYIGGGFGTTSLVSSPYKENELYGTVAFHKIIKNQTFHIGLQPGLVFRNLDVGNLVFPDQYDRETGTFNPGISSEEPIDIAEKAVGLNINVGIAYGLRINKFNSKISIAGRNLNKTNLSLTEIAFKQSQQWIIEAKTDYFLTNIDLLKAFVMLRTDSYKTETFIGASLNHRLIRHNILMNEISGGAYLVFRNNDYPNNVVINMNIGIQNIKVGFAYSYNFIGNEASANSFNTFELVLLFVGLNNNLENYRVPCEIY